MPPHSSLGPPDHFWVFLGSEGNMGPGKFWGNLKIWKFFKKGLEFWGNLKKNSPQKTPLGRPTETRGAGLGGPTFFPPTPTGPRGASARSRVTSRQSFHPTRAPRPLARLCFSRGEPTNDLPHLRPQKKPRPAKKGDDPGGFFANGATRVFLG